MKKLFSVILSFLLVFSCADSNNEQIISKSHKNEVFNSLKTISQAHLDTLNWDIELLQQDIDVYNNHQQVFNEFPLNKLPFPVAKYEYAVSSEPFSFAIDSFIFKGFHIGEYEDYNSDIIRNKLTLIFLVDSINIEENHLVDSRNYPYLTAQGTLNAFNNRYDWVFSSSPDAHSTLFVNMKLFDLRFGQTIIIYPRHDNYFVYEQIDKSVDSTKDNAEFLNSLKSQNGFIQKLKMIKQ